MKCPNCGSDQAEGLVECGKCNIIFSKFQNRQGGSQSSIQGYVGSPISSSPVRASSGPGFFSSSLFVYILTSAALVALWFIVAPSSGLPVPEGAYVNPAEHFAVRLNPDWKTNQVDAYEFQPGQSPGWSALSVRRYLFNEDPNVSDFMDRKKDSVGFLMTYNNTDAAKGSVQPFFSIVSFKGPLPSIDDGNKEELSKVLGQALSTSQGYSEFIQESAQALEVDRLGSLKITGRAKGQVEVAPEGWAPIGFGLQMKRAATYRPVDMKLVQYLIPGGEKNYIITYGADATDFLTHEKAFEETVSQFRVTSRFSMHRILGLYREWAFWLLISLVVGIYKWVFSR